MKKALLLTLMLLLVASAALAAPLTDFAHHKFQIDAAYNPNNVQKMYNIQYTPPIPVPIGGTYNMSMPNTGEVSGNVTWAFSDVAALRVGASGFAPVNLQNNIGKGIDRIGMTQVNAQIILGFADYFQPFAGVQYATIDANSMQNSKFTQNNIGWCVGGQFSVPFAQAFKANASMMYGTYMSSAYAGLSMALGENIDLDGGYSFEMYNTSKIQDNSASNLNYDSTTINTGGLRLGLSFRI